MYLATKLCIAMRFATPISAVSSVASACSAKASRNSSINDYNSIKNI